MNINKSLEEFKHVTGIISIGFMNLKTHENFYIINDEIKDFKKIIEDLSHFIKEKILDLKINSFRFNGSVQSILGFAEDDIFIVLIFQNNTNLSILKTKIDKLLNDILINL